jgi:carbon-monoxide dehydrogenase large subunit
MCAGHFKLRRGDVESGFREADFIFEDIFRSPAAQHVALEPHVTVAQFVEGKLTLWTSTQMPHAVRAQMAELFNLPQSRVRVIVETLGAVSVRRARSGWSRSLRSWRLKSKRPVKIVLSREGRVCHRVQTPGDHSHQDRRDERRHAGGRDRLPANFNTGAYSDIGPVVARNGGSAMSGRTRFPMCGSTLLR